MINRPEKVGRALPAVLPPLPEGQPNDRLGLARWLVSAGSSFDCPSLGKSNMGAFIWGGPIVKTSENFVRRRNGRFTRIA
jgi:hypothetical protein